LSQETQTLELLSLETFQPKPEVLSLESILILLLKASYNLSINDIEHIKTYGHVMFESGCCEGADRVLDTLKMFGTFAVKVTPSSAPINGSQKPL
jgi:hypothetical protein